MKTRLTSPTNTNSPRATAEMEELVALEQRILGLKEVADEIDPYSPLTLGMQKKLIELEVELSHDPFRLTNQILKTMEDALEAREKMRQELGLDHEPDHLFTTTSPTKH